MWSILNLSNTESSILIQNALEFTSSSELWISLLLYTSNTQQQKALNTVWDARDFKIWFLCLSSF